MKKNYFTLVWAILCFTTAFAQESQKNFINYQGVARNVGNELMVDESMNITVGVRFGAANASVVYEENHNINTDANGVFSLLIGNGSTIAGNYDALPWGSAATFVTVSINGTEIGTTEMMAVPYAISAGSMKDPLAEEVQYDNSFSGLRATTAQEAIDELVTEGSVDADSDPSNELQVLSFDAVTNALSLSDGNTVTIPSGGTDADADPTNELQTISFDAASNKISLTDGGEITIPSGGTDADADPSNELQILSFDAGTNELSLSDGGTVTLPSGGTDADADPTNEIQDISLSGTELTITDGSTIDLTPIIPPGGTDNQELTFDETTKILEIEDGNTVDLSSLSGGTGSSLWTDGTNSAYIDRRVGINTGGGIQKTLFEIAGVPGVSEDVGFTNALFTITDNEITGGPFQMVMGGKAIQTLADGAVSNMTLNSEGGNVGIGTFPTTTLDVDGDARIRNLGGSGQRNVMADANGNLVIGSSGGGGSLWNEDTNGISRLTGQIGIGHQSGGDAKLFVQNALPDIRNGIRSSVFNDGYKVAISASAEARGSDTNNTFGIRSDARAESTGSAWAYRGDIGGAGTGRKYGLDLIFYDGTGGEKFGIYSKGEDKNYFSGNLGLGVENPTSKLDIDGSIRSRSLSGSGQRNIVADADGNLVIGIGGAGSSLWSETGEDINFVGGKVGIGIENPVNSLHIVSDDGSPARFQSMADQSWVSFYNSSGYVGYAGVFTNGQDMDFGTGLFNGTSKVHLTTGAIPKLTVVPNGNVGIGTTNPSVKLEVAGDVKTSGEVHGPTTGNANMIPVAYGKVSADGVIEEGSGNFTISKTGNYYFIVIDGYSVSDAGECSMVATRRTSPLTDELGFITVGYGSSGGSGALFARTYNISGTGSDSPFSFVIYRQ